MEAVSYNKSYGYLEGIVHGYKNQLLRRRDFENLTQSENLEDIKLQLHGAYGDVLTGLSNEASTGDLAVLTTEKLVSEFKYLRGNATGSLAKFLDFITYAYMIDNVMLLITGTLHERDTRELLDKCHPLGWFEALPVLTISTNLHELYHAVLVESPIAEFFRGSLTQNDLDELHVEIIRNTLYKNYLEAFNTFITTDPELSHTPTSEVMQEILAFEADRRSISITLNSFDTDLSKADRRKLYPALGRLYPAGTLMLARADDVQSVRSAVDHIPEYRSIFERAGMLADSRNFDAALAYDSLLQPTERSLEDVFYEVEMSMYRLAFTRQFSHCIVYAWMKLKEQEIRNIIWIAECVIQQQKDRIHNYICVL